MANAWLIHVKATMKKHPGKSFKLVLKEAKKTYKKSGSSCTKKCATKCKKSRKARKTRKTRKRSSKKGRK